MISYNTKDWLHTLFKFNKADTMLPLLPILFGIGAFSGIIAYLELEYWKLSANSVVRNLPIMHSLLGFAISMILVFRTNTAYDRWWEGRKLWGSLVNNSRNLALKLSAILPDPSDEQRVFFRKIIPAFAFGLHQHLRKETTRMMLFEDEPGKKILTRLDAEKHLPVQITGLMYKHIRQMQLDGTLQKEDVLNLNDQLQSFMDICGACERIKNTPIPYSYGVFLKKFISVYILTLPFGYVFQLGYYVIPVVMFVSYVLLSLEVIAEEIEEPFGGDENDLPTLKMSENIQKNVEEIL